MQQALEPLAPTFSLARFVEGVHVVECDDGGAMRVERLPDGRTRLIFRALAGGQADLYATGPRTRALFKNSRGVLRAFGVTFKPGWSVPLLGVPANELTDKLVRLEDIWGHAASELCEELLAAPKLTDAVDRVTRAFARRPLRDFEPASARLAREATRLLEGEENRVADVAARLGITARHLRRAFTESIGVAPKDFARTARLQRAVKSAASSSDWCRIAADAGYYDQAHLISEFRELIGLTPGAFMRRAAA